VISFVLKFLPGTGRGTATWRWRGQLKEGWLF
jgi:hypothetical protein